MSFPADVECFVDSYLVSYQTTFRPQEPPATSFKDSQYSIWLFLAKSIPRTLWNHPGEFRKQVESLPLVLFAASCGDAPQWRLAYVALSYIAHAYIWGAGVGAPTPAEDYELTLDVLPPNLAIPLRHLADHLGVQPGLTFSGLCAWNWQRKHPLAPGKPEQAENLEPIFSFTGTKEEEKYIATQLMVETLAGEAIRQALATSKAVGDNNVEHLVEALGELVPALKACQEQLSHIWDGSDSDVFYRRVKPFLTGFGATSALANGVFFRSSPENSAKGEWLKLSGASASQSCVLPTLDALLGVTHAAESCQKYSLRMQQAMPRSHVQFIEAIQCFPSVNDFVVARRDDMRLLNAYSNAVIALEGYRELHFSVIGPARRITVAVDNDGPTASPAQTRLTGPVVAVMT